MIEIVPAILEKSFADIKEKLSRVQRFSREVQIDVVDGIFAPNTTWPFAGARGQEEFQKIASQEEGLPFWEDFDFQFDLMVENPEKLSRDLVSAGARAIILHAEAQGVLKAMKALQEFRAGEFPVVLGIALSCAAAPEELVPFAGLYDFVQVMGIAKAGFQGQKFDSRALNLVKSLRVEFPELVLQVDGGVGREHIEEVVRAGASRIVEGSMIVGSDNPKKTFEELKLKANTR